MIHETGYWNSNGVERWHYHSTNVNDWIISFLSDKKESQIYDFGCGMGDYLHNLHKNGFTNIVGFESDPPKLYNEFEIRKQNLATPFKLDKKGIIISLEVGEHIPQKYESIFLNNLYENCSDYLIISWAVRGQGGYGHYNELNNDEIIPKIESLGFKLLNDETESARKVPEDNCWYFRNTLMIFKKIQ